MNIFRDSKSENLIFRDERVFNADYSPEEIIGREKEIHEMALAFKAVERKARIPSMILSGPPGTGKTCCTKYVLKQLQEYTQRAIIIYINCWQNGTRHSILTRILERIDPLAPQSGMTVDRILDKIGTYLKNSKKTAIVVLDEADALMQKNEHEVFYDLLRASETIGIEISVIAITNNPEFVIALDKRIRSSMAQMSIKFNQYSPEEMKGILTERATLGIYNDTYDEEVIGKCAAFAAKNGGDARIGITLLWLSGRETEARNGGKITPDDVEAAKQHITTVIGAVNENNKTGINELEKRILELLGDGELESTDIYKKLGIAERTGRRHLEKMESGCILESRRAEEKRGNVRIFRIKKK
ncbi:MAG: AAA family ATPase [Candidatus Micrarchaeota archaeon]